MRAPSLRELRRIAERLDPKRIADGYELRRPLESYVNYQVGGDWVKAEAAFRAIVNRHVALVASLGFEAEEYAPPMSEEERRHYAVTEPPVPWEGLRAFAENGSLATEGQVESMAQELAVRRGRSRLEPGDLSAEDCVKAAANFGIDLACGACASQFYTGYGGYDHDDRCKSVLRGIVMKQSISLEVLPALQEADLVPRQVSATGDAYGSPVMIGAPIVACSHPSWFWDWDEDRAMSPPKRRCSSCRAEAPPAVREIQVGDRLRWEPSDGSTMVVESVLDGLPFVGLCFDCRSAVTHHVPLFHQDATARWNRVLVYEDGSAAKYPEKKE